MIEETDNKTVAPPISDEIAVISKDVDVTKGFFLENPDPTILSESKGKGLKLYDEIARDSHAGAVLQSRYLAVSGEKYDITPGDETPKAQEIADFVENALKATNFRQILQELLQGILFGFFNAEVMWKIRDGKIVPAKFIGKHPRRFGFTMDRELRLLTKDNPQKGEELPERKIITFSYGDSDNPYGKGIGQKLWWSVWFKKHGIKFWLIFLDKFGMPTGVGKYPTGTTDPKVKQTLLDAIDAIHSETGVAIPENMTLDLLEASRGGKPAYETLCEYMDKQISKAVLGQTLTTEVSGGSLAASKTHDEVRQDIKEADAGLLAECLNRSVIRWIVDFNFAGAAVYPALRFITQKEQTLKDLAERDEVLVNQIGVEVDPEYFYDTYNLPRPPGGAKITRPVAPPRPNPASFSDKNKNKTEKQFTPPQQALEGLADTALAATDLTGNEKQILAIVEAADTYEEAMENLLEFYPQMQVSSLQSGLETALLTAELHGRAMVKNG